MKARILPLLLVISLHPLTSGPAPAQEPAIDPREAHLADLRQLTRGGENAEAYWSPDGRELVFQSTRPPYACDQIFRAKADGSGEAVRVSTGKGRTTCAYFTADGRRVVYSSTHHKGDACPSPPDRSQGYVWPVDSAFEIWSVAPDGSAPLRLTDNDAYDAETTVCAKDGSLLFTSTRDGDLELYRMDADGGNVKRLTNAPGYDGGAFFSPDCAKIVWRASRPKEGTELDDYRGLLGRGLVRPGKLEIWVADADGGEARQITYLDAASFAPSFYPSGERIVFSSNYGDPKGREFELWAVGVDGSGLERLTWSPGFDGFPLFSPDGSRLAFASNRNQGKEGETNVFVARWVDRPLNPPTPGEAAAADRFQDDVRWLADDAREGRGIGTQGLAESSRWLAQRFEALGLAPGGGIGDKEGKGTWFQSFDVPVAVEVKPRTAVSLDGTPLSREDLRPLAFSANAEASGEVVAAGYGITSSKLGIDDYKGVDAKGKIVVVRRFTPAGGPFDMKEVEQRYGDLRYKAFNAREHGAVGMIVVDTAEATEAPLPALTVSSIIGAGGDAGIPVVAVKREAGAKLFEGRHQATLKIDLDHRTRPAVNVVGVVRAGAPDRLPGAVVVGAHYDHLGKGGASSLSPDSAEIHNGADDNASGTAALLEVARDLAARRDTLRRDVWLVAFAGEEIGVLGSTAFTRHPPEGLEVANLVAMLNMDMVGRLRGNLLSVLGGESAEEWKEIVKPACDRALLACTLSGDGYGPSDHSPFYAAGVPVLHFFTGVHGDYHKPTDDAPKVNAAGGARIAGLVAGLAKEIADRPGKLTYKNAPAPVTTGDARSFGASLGTVPDYAGNGRPGVLLAGVRPGSAAEKAGLRRGDLLVELAGTPVRDINDMMFALRKAKPGEKATAVVERDGGRVTVDVTFGGRP